MSLSSDKKLIMIKPNGNHSNRLLQNLHFEVFCKKHNIEYHNPTFADMAPYYVEPCSAETSSYYDMLQIDLLGSLFRHSRLIKKIFSVVWIASKLGFIKLMRFDNKKEESICEDLLLNSFTKNDKIYVAGWNFRLPELVEKYRDEMKKKYSLKSSYYENNDLVKKIQELKEQNYTLIGVHIRRGDYKKWENGIYCFDDEVYRKQMERISQTLLKKGKTNCLFILFSNEQLNFKESPTMIISKEKWYIDQHIMSVCDYLIGPPSTFTFWASYIGSAKVFHMYDSNCNFDIDL